MVWYLVPVKFFEDAGYAAVNEFGEPCYLANMRFHVGRDSQRPTEGLYGVPEETIVPSNWTRLDEVESQKRFEILFGRKPEKYEITQKAEDAYYAQEETEQKIPEQNPSRGDIL